MTPLVYFFLSIILLSLYIGLYWTARLLSHIATQWQSNSICIEWSVMKKIAAGYAFAFVFTLATVISTWGVVRLE